MSSTLGLLSLLSALDSCTHFSHSAFPQTLDYVFSIASVVRLLPNYPLFARFLP
uniref:Expressed protein n=1 Tax=Echinococcus granulosus TaxID=6210 RepID=A0A068X0J6_ECHGR|nr:expressed protein [Echinococcus granulosus]